METAQKAAFALENIRHALATHPLPGVTGQKKMAPAPVDGQASRWKPTDLCREAGVLLLLYPHATTEASPALHLVFIRRPEYPGAHSGQIAFPGGRREDGESLQQTALREAHEEIGVAPESVRILGRLSSLYTPPSNFCIYPYVAYTTRRPNFTLDAREVAELIETPLYLLANSQIHKEEVWHFEKYGQRKIPYFEVFGHKVWGATAMILSEFLTLLAHNSL